MIPPLEIQVRYGDLDVMGHVNNCIYFSYFEMARVYYFGKLLGKDWDWKTNGVLVAKNEAEYLEPILLVDQPEIHMWCEKIGSKSFTVAYKIVVGDKICTTGRTIMVCFDAVQNRSIEVPDEMRLVLQEIQID